MNDLFIKHIITRPVTIYPNELNENIDKIIIKKVKEAYENSNQYTDFGYLKVNSIRLLSRTIGQFLTGYFNAGITYTVKFECNIARPCIGQKIQCYVKNKNTVGVLAVSYPEPIYDVLLIAEQHTDKTIYNQLAKDDFVVINVEKFSFQQNKILVVGKIIEKRGEVNIIALNNNIQQLDDSYNLLDINADKAFMYNPKLGNYEQLLIARRIIDTLPDWKDRKNLVNNYEYLEKMLIKSKNIINFNYAKLVEIIATIKIQDKSLLEKYDSMPIKYVGLEESSGGFIQYIADYRKKNSSYSSNDNLYGFTQKSQSQTQSQTQSQSQSGDVIDWDTKIKRLDMSSREFFAKYYPKTNIGLSYENPLQEVQTPIPEAEIITANGSVKVEKGEYEYHEIKQHFMLLSEILTAIKIQKIGGIFILKIFDIFTNNTAKYIQLLASMYEQLYLIKPRTVRQTTSEKYLVCYGFNGVQPNIITQLQTICDEFRKNGKYSQEQITGENLTNLLTNVLNIELDDNLCIAMKKFNETEIVAQSAKIAEARQLKQTKNGNVIETNEMKKTRLRTAQEWLATYGL